MDVYIFKQNYTIVISVYYFVTVLYMPRSASDPSNLHLMMWENLHY
jgi:hypothetical protein